MVALLVSTTNSVKNVFCVFCLLLTSSSLFAQQQTLLGSAEIHRHVDSDAAGIAEAFPVTASASGQVNTISIFVDGSNTAATIWVGVYAAYSGRPRSLLSQGAILNPAAGQWNSVAVPGVQVTQGRHYWLALLGSRGQIHFRDHTGYSYCYSVSSQQTGLTTLPPTWSSGSKSSSCLVSLYGSGSTSRNVSVSLSPGTASLLLGQQMQFTASITGTTNTAVTWTASGGTVTSSGLYTAPNAAGSYSVTATSVADSTKHATSITTVSQISVAISPSSASLQTGGQQQFNASVSGTSNTAVTWSASGGTVSSAGLYTAPSTPGTYKLMATSIADSTKSASSTVRVSTPISVSVSPTSTSVQTGGQQQFTAYISGTSNTAVTWSASGGSINTAGLYTAPGAAGTYTVQAISVADPTKSAWASISVTTPMISVTISPTSTLMPEKWQQQFAATISGTTNTAVTWAVTQGSGTITQTGLYTAPQVAGTNIVTVTSVADSSKLANATVNVSAPHTVSLTWSPSSSSGISYYNLYRGTVNGGPYSLLKSGISSTSYSDASVQSGSTYYYVSTAVDSTGSESVYSDQATAVIPFP